MYQTFEGVAYTNQLFKLAIGLGIGFGFTSLSRRVRSRGFHQPMLGSWAPDLPFPSEWAGESEAPAVSVLVLPFP